MLAKFYVGEANLNNAQAMGAIVVKYFNGASFSHGSGLWRGKFEDNITIEVAQPVKLSVESFKKLCGLMAADLKKAYKQEVVLLVYLDTKGVFYV